jgi:hypothetical protein
MLTGGVKTARVLGTERAPQARTTYAAASANEVTLLAEIAAARAGAGDRRA